MNKIQAMLVLLLVLAFGGAVAQAGDAGQAVLPQALVLPQGVELSDEELETVSGQLAPKAAAFVVGAAIGAVSGAIAGAWHSHQVRGYVAWESVAVGAGLGAATGAANVWRSLRYPGR
jgi:lactobin A/cerein 7B family class IIb bacteriocin